MIATLDLVEMRRGGGVLTAATLAGATTLPLDVTLDYDEGGGSLSLNDVVYTYTAVGEDFVTLATGLVADAAVDDPAWALDAQAQLEETWLAWVDLGDGGDTVPAQIPTGLVGYFPEGDTATGQAIEVEATDDGYRVLDRPDQPVLLDGASVDASTLDVDSLPPVPTTDGDAPDNATTVTPIGGIGSMFYRWTEITNADPVTYRLHVRAGSAPTTDGTYEVAAGVGLTSAAVRKLKDGTAIVGDGSVTYHAVVTVEDADGPGPASADVTGVPAQVTNADIAVGAITTNLLTANDAFIDALNATDFTGVTMTAPIVRTAASGRRVEVSGPNNWLAFYSGSGSEQLPGYMEADVVGNFARLVIAAPDTDEPLKSQVNYRNMILMQEDTTDATATRVSRVISVRTGHFFIETAGGALIHVDGSGSDPDIDLDSAFLRNFTAGDGAVGAGTFRDSVDARVSAVAPTVTMTTGGVGTGAFRDSVDARAAVALAGNIRRTTAATGVDRWVARHWKNVSATTISTTEIGYFDSTCLEGEVKRHAFAATSLNPLVAVESVVTNAEGGFAEPGSVVNVAADATVVAVGDLLVPSTTVNGRVKADNTVTNPRLIVGVARTAKAAGANGLVKVYIK